jgi:RNA polymerase sigma-70 factor (ECF subfamily)
VNPPDAPLPPPQDADELSLELVARAKGGDRAAFGALYERYHDTLLLAVRMHLGARLRAHLVSEDILQSVAVDALRAIEGVRAETPAGLRHYLHQMIVNKIRSRAQRLDTVKRAGEVPLTPSVEATLGSDDPPRYSDPGRFERIERALDALPEEMRRVIVLRRVDGLDYATVAAQLARSEEATRKLYSRAMARLTLSLEGGSSGS